MIKLNLPLKPDTDKLFEYLNGINDRQWYTNFGPLHQELTYALEQQLQVENLLLVTNATLGLQIAAAVLGLKHVITTPFSFVATTAAMAWRNVGFTFADIDSQTLNLDPEKAAAALHQVPEADAVLATHVYGNPCDLESFAELTASQGKKLLYDAAHGFGVTVKGKSLLSFGDASVVSFHATKVFSTIEGGAIIFKRKSDYDRAKRMISFGMDANGEIHDLGINAKMGEYHAAVGLCNLSQIETVLEHRRECFAHYQKLLVPRVKLPLWHPDAILNGAYMPVIFESSEDRIKCEKVLTSRNIGHRRYFSPSLDTLYPSVHSRNRLDNSHRIASRVLCLPMHAYLTQSDVSQVCHSITEALP
ncbi:DegT/DnrJ/EryC1/StrS family aminotransferase [Lacimicrobium alkaliphilum]|nr:DegT/DnrJ/EryC1/StrS family aminotransferase [Lacimicrobium alkaliphilum]